MGAKVHFITRTWVNHVEWDYTVSEQWYGDAIQMLADLARLNTPIGAFIVDSQGTILSSLEIW